MTERYVHAPGVLLFNVEDLASSVQAALSTRPGQCAVTHRGARSATALLDADAAELLRRFALPTALVEAVAQYSEAHDADPHAVLDLAYPILRGLIQAGFIVPAGDGDGAEDLPRSPERVGEFEIVAVVQSLPDVAVYRARDAAGRAALVKALKDTEDGPGRARLAHEAAVLAHCTGCRVPAVLHDGSAGRQPFLALEWIDGVRVLDYASLHRRPWDPASRTALLTLAQRILAAYASLHDRGVLHADVHPKNLLVCRDGQPTIIDFGLSCVSGQTRLGTPPRGGVLAYYEPEVAAARLRDQPAPPATRRGEQFAIGALLHAVFTGRHHVAEVGDVAQVLRRIAHEPPLPFVEHGAAPWPPVEAVLAKMLAKNPADRFDAIADAARALGDATSDASGDRGVPSLAAKTFPQTVIERLSRDGGLVDRGLPTAPRASVNYGAAGIAYFFYRLALIQDDPAHLLAASRWLSWAQRARHDRLAYHSGEVNILPERVGRVSMYHSPAGTACVDALVAHARGDLVGAAEATRTFVAESTNPCANLDLTIGRASTLVGAALLVEALRGTGLAERTLLARLGDDTLAGIVGSLPPELGSTGPMRLRGVAHGWAGILFAALRWCAATRGEVPGQVNDWLAQFAALGTESGGHLYWRGPHDPVMHGGWCHGSAGYTHLWATAAELFGDEAYADLALRTAETSWAHPEAVSTLCCGLAGQAYAMLAAHRISGAAVGRPGRADGMAVGAARGHPALPAAQPVERRPRHRPGGARTGPTESGHGAAVRRRALARQPCVERLRPVATAVATGLGQLVDDILARRFRVTRAAGPGRVFEPRSAPDTSTAPPREPTAPHTARAGVVALVTVACCTLPPLLAGGAFAGVGVGGLAGGLVAIAVVILAAARGCGGGRNSSIPYHDIRTQPAERQGGDR